MDAIPTSLIVFSVAQLIIAAIMVVLIISFVVTADKSRELLEHIAKPYIAMNRLVEQLDKEAEKKRAETIEKLRKRGIVRIATQDEIAAGTNTDTPIVTPVSFKKTRSQTIKKLRENGCTVRIIKPKKTESVAKRRPVAKKTGAKKGKR